MGTLYGNWLKQVIDEALKHRNTAADDDEKGQFVVLEDRIFKELQQINFLSSKAWLPDF